jgi:hypothetical protein
MELFGLITGIGIFGLGLFFLGICLGGADSMRQRRRVAFYQQILRARASLGARGPATGSNTAGH